VHSDGCLPISCPICIKDDCPVRHHPIQRNPYQSLRYSWIIRSRLQHRL
jgi:hypothetical protein